jgi:hypothetical protein
MQAIDRTGWGRGAIRRPYSAPLVPLIILLFLAVATLAPQPAVFPLFPIFLVALFVVGGGVRAGRGPARGPVLRVGGGGGRSPRLAAWRGR